MRRNRKSPTTKARFFSSLLIFAAVLFVLWASALPSVAVAQDAVNSVDAGEVNRNVLAWARGRLGMGVLRDIPHDLLHFRRSWSS